MIKCQICNQEFKTNLGGDLTKHLNVIHNISMEDYYILTKLNGIEPKCQCGLCNERPFFNRGKFSKYVIGHEKFKWREKQYVKLYGHPKCLNPNCNNNVPFHRGKPQKYCSHGCSIICQTNNWNQEKVKKTVNEKYGVDNVFQLETIKEKSKETMLNKHGVEYIMKSDEVKNKLKLNNLKKYGVEFPQSLSHVKEKQKQTLLKNHGVTHFSKTTKFKEIASANMCKYNQNLNSNHKIRLYKNTHLYYQSMNEYRFLEFCEKHNLLHYVDNSPTFKYLDSSMGKWHLPDFKFKSKYIIEIKSSYWLNKQGGWDKINSKKKSVELNGFQYIFILDENYNEFSKICL